MKKWNLKVLCSMGVLLAAQIVLSRFCSFSVWNMKIGVAFIPVVLCALLFGPLASAAVSALGDFLGAILFPIGAYFPGFTLTAFFSGLLWGIVAKNQSVPRILLAVALNQLLCSLLLNSLWVSVLYHSPFLPVLATRVVQCAIVGPVQFIVVFLLRKPMVQLRKQVEL